MIKSMTGFGKSTLELSNKKINIEIKSLNSKQFDLSCKIPSWLKNKEYEIRSYLSEQVERGKVDFSIYYESVSQEKELNINEDLVVAYHQKLSQLAKKLNDPNVPILELVLKNPDVYKSEKEDVKEDEWEVVFVGIKNTVHQFNEFRLQEGETLMNDLKGRIQLILKLLENIEKLAPLRVEKIKKRIAENLNVLTENKKTIDQNRFEQELIYYLEKIDVTEEKIRLKSHCEYFINTAIEPQSQGRKLGFICQEIGREINTIGSKANDAEIQQLVVQMKDELEKIKEQLMNIL
jgi:uncharacterized protein (TIGR00255 family)